MLSFKLASQTFKRNLAYYVPFIGAQATFVGIIYILAILLLAVSNTDRAFEYAKVAIYLILALLVPLALLFFLRISAHLARLRQKELSLYNLLGLNRMRLFLVVNWLDLLQFVVSSLLGVALGVTLTKISLLVFNYYMQSIIIHQQSFSWAALKVALSAYALIWLVVFAVDCLHLRLRSPLKMWQKAITPPRLTTHPLAVLVMIISGIAAIVILAAAYYLALVPKSAESAFVMLGPAVTLGIIGTYLFFKSCLQLIVWSLKRWRTVAYFKPVFINLGILASRLKQTASGMAMLSLTCSVAAVAICSSLTLQVAEVRYAQTYTPTDVALFGKKQVSAAQLTQYATKIAQKHHTTITDLYSFRMVIPSSNYRYVGMLNKSHLSLQKMPNDNFARYTQVYGLTLHDFNHLMNRDYHFTLGNNEILVYKSPTSYHYKTLTANGHTYKVTPIYEGCFVNPGDAYTTSICIIAKDEAQLTAITNQTAKNAISFNLTGAHDDKILASVAFTAPASSSDITSLTIARLADSVTQIYRGVAFDGLLFGVIFLLGALLLMYYKQLAEGVADRKRIKTLKQVGMSDDDIEKTLKFQMEMVFFLPLVVMLGNSWVAMQLVRRALAVIGVEDFTGISYIVIIVLALMALCYWLMYRFTRRVYFDILKR